MTIRLYLSYTCILFHVTSNKYQMVKRYYTPVSQVAIMLILLIFVILLIVHRTNIARIAET